jgi:GTPase SAR1 family protein
MNVRDHSKDFNIPTNTRKHHEIFPNNIFCVITGSTGSGKTNLLVHLLKEENLLNYYHVYVYSATLHQPAYEHLKEYYNTLEKLIKQKLNQSIRIAHFFDVDTDIQNPSELDKDKNHVMIFDDVMMEHQDIIKQYFCQGRHSNVNVFYLCQSLHKLAKHCIRDNANMFILFRQDDKTLKYFYETHISGDMEFAEFKNFCDGAWMKKHGFVVINIWDDAYCGRYWANYKSIFIPKNYSQ